MSDRQYRRALWRRRHGKKTLVQRGPEPVRYYARQGNLPRLPFARWLKARLERDGLAYLLARTGMPERRVFAIISGYMHQHGRLRPVDGVHIDTVDRALLGYDENINDLYPMEEESYVEGSGREVSAN